MVGKKGGRRMEGNLMVRVKYPRIVKEDGVFAAYCNEFGLATCGDTEEDAAENLTNAIKSYCESLKDQFELEEITKKLTEQGAQVEVVSPVKMGRKDSLPVLI